MERSEREYGKGGWVGIGTPQANPTVEAEFRRLLPEDMEMVTTRLQGSATSSDQRLMDNLVGVEGALAAYDALKPDVFGFACTGSSYLLGAAREAEIVAAATAKVGYPVITAAQAVLASLQALGASRIAVLAPYPQNIIDASVAFWEAEGLTVTAAKRIDIGSADTRWIYALSSKDAAAALAELPTLAAIRDLGPGMGKPLLSSNYCLAWAVMQALGDELEPWSAAGATLRLS